MAPTPPRRGLLLAAAAAACASCAAPVLAGTAPLADQLPDLRQEAPANITVRHVGSRWLLGFRSSVQNVGTGPLVIDGARAGTAVRDMRADQLVRRENGTFRRIRGVGFVRYITSADHSHWHFLPFERYELRRASDGVRIARDGKSGFCLGDRYRVEPAPAGALADPVYVTNCGLRSPGRLRIREGISVGWADDYAAYLDGQHVDITRVPSGRYVLVHRVNPSGRLLESGRRNNSASALVELTRTASGVRVRVISRSAAPR